MNFRSLRFGAEYALARFALILIPRLPRSAVFRLAQGLATASARFARNERRIAKANLDLAYGGSKSDAEKHAIIRKSFQSFALMMLDMFWFARNTDSRVREWVTFDRAFDRVFAPGPNICITAHMGNWELLGMAFSQRGRPLVSVAAPLANRRLNRLFVSLRKLTGQRILSKHGAVRGLLRTLKNGGKIALVMDQNTKPSDGGIFLDFLGRPAPMSTTAAALGLRTGAEIIIGTCIADERGHYHVPAPTQIQVTGEMDESSLTRAISGGIEALVRAHPEHWLWMYKRWKYIAPWCAADDYPFYAKRLSERDRAIQNTRQGPRATGARPPV